MTMPKKIGAVLVLGGLSLAFVAAVALVLAGAGARLGWWNFRTGFVILGWGAYGGLAAAGFSALAFGAAWWSPMSRLYRGLAVLGVVIGLLTAAVPWQWKRTAQTVPPIHDITTDVAQPPEFVAIRPLRTAWPNPADYGGPEVAAQQTAYVGYSDIRPLILPLPPDQAFDRALAVAREMCWEIVDARAADGRIEATHTTFWFGFKDDIVVRIQPAPEGSRIDVRSVSRVGRSDVGTNARRIRSYLKRLIA